MQAARYRATSRRHRTFANGKILGGSGKSVARCHRTVLAYWKFESISLQRRVMQTFGPARAT